MCDLAVGKRLELIIPGGLSLQLPFKSIAATRCFNCSSHLGSNLAFSFLNLRGTFEVQGTVEDIKTCTCTVNLGETDCFWLRCSGRCHIASNIEIRSQRLSGILMIADDKGGAGGREKS